MNDLENNHSDFVELDPSGRYGRYNEMLGKGAAKTVFRAFDQYEGIEVAWNQVKLFNFLQSPKELERLYCEIHLLKTLKHRNIMKLYASWVDTSKRNINFVTEMFTSGTLREYRHKHKKVDMRAVKNWCRQILMGLLYLHSHNPPVIHRDLKCDNIFVNGNHGEIKIGDLGLASVLRKSQEAHCVGTPEFMAPEVYAEEYNELADIYSFGMCILEMVTFEYPYSECTNSAQIYKKVTSGKKPDALNKVEDQEVRQFIEKCLVNASVRLSARELLSDPFLQVEDCDQSNVVAIECQKELEHAFPELGFKEKIYPCNEYRDPSRIQDGSSNQIDENERDGIDLFEHEEHLPQVDITIKGKKKSDGSIFLRLRMSDKDDHLRNIYFPFDVENDTALSVATEMVGELDITDQDVTKIADMIDGEIVTLVPDWTTGPGFEDGPDLTNLCHNCASTHTSIGSYKQMMNCCEEGCGAMHGRFEEYIYNVEDWDQHGSIECSEIDSGDGHFAREHEQLAEAKNLTQSLSAGDTSSSSYDISVDYESEINNAMRFLKAV